jgi:hypothetical protein
MTRFDIASRWSRRQLRAVLLSSAFGCAAIAAVGAQTQTRRTSTDTVTKFEIYGFGQADMIHDFQRIDPLWFDVNRPTRLPAFSTQFGANDNTFLSARQSRFGVKARTPTSRGDVLSQFEFDMFGVGVDAGQTTIRLRLAYGQWGRFGAGQLWSPFMDIDVFPNILDYWGPNGMVFFRNVQVFWRPIDRGPTNLTLALERPGASADAGDFADRIQIQNVRPHFRWPDFSTGLRIGGKHGHVKLAGIIRDIAWVQVPTDTFDLSGHVTGWGASLTGAYKWRNDLDVLRLSTTYGAGIQNYFNDAPVDVGIKRNVNNFRAPIGGEALPIFGAMVFLDHSWNSRFTSSIGWSMVNIDNSDLQPVDAFHNGQYAIVNVLWTPVKNVLMGIEGQYGGRSNFVDDFSFDGYRVQFSFKYSFMQHIGGKP